MERSKNMKVTMLESMANELFLDLLEYLSTTHAMRAFQGLNGRFDDLLYQHIQLYGIDFRSMSKDNFDTICEYLPSIASRIPSLSLSEDNETPQHVELFLSDGLLLNQFINLRSLSYFNIRSGEIMTRMMLQWSNLHQLTHLTLLNCSFEEEKPDQLCVMNCIWSLPKLKHCHMNFYGYSIYNLCNITAISLSLEYLWLERFLKRDELIHLYSQTPRLRSLCGCLISFDNHLSSIFALPLMTVLELSVVSSVSSDGMQVSLVSMPNLRQLRVDMKDHVLNGSRWEEIIGDWLPMLKIFQLRMTFELNRRKVNKYIDELVDSFRTDFWIKEHKWFIRCLVPSAYIRPICLYTVPYAFTDFELNLYRDGNQSKSTCLNEEHYWSYDHVHNLSYLSDLYSEYGLLSSSHVHFPNIHHLFVTFPVRNHFWSIFPRFDQLKRLTVKLTDGHPNDVIFEIQSLLDKTPCLYSLSFKAWSRSTIPMFKNTSTSVYQLDFQDLLDDHHYGFFNDEQCIELSQSSLGIQCEILSIQVRNRTNIIDLINLMSNLRVLIIRSADDRLYGYPAQYLKIHNDELLEWLRECLPSTCTIARCVGNVIKNIRIWIR